jgi:hypothetical protein
MQRCKRCASEATLSPHSHAECGKTGKNESRRVSPKKNLPG